MQFLKKFYIISIVC